MYCVIPAAGRGVRFNELGKNYPKCVLPYKEVPIIVHNIRLALDAGAREVSVVVGHQGDKIREIVGMYFSEDSRVRFVEYAETAGRGGPGVSIYCGIPDNIGDEPILVLLSDIVVDHVQITDSRTSWISVQKVSDWERWCMVETKDRTVVEFHDKPRDMPPTTHAVSGVYYFTDAAWFRSCLVDAIEDTHNGEVQISSAMSRYMEKENIYTKHVKIVDFGTLQEYLENRGVRNSRSFNTLFHSGDETTITKTSVVHPEKIHAEANWYDNLPTPIKVMTPRIFDKTLYGDRPSYTMERVDSPTLRELYLYLESDPIFWAEVFTKLFDLTDKFKFYVKPGQHQFFFRNLEKTYARFTEVEAEGIENEDHAFMSKFYDMTYAGEFDIFPDSLFHGDLCFSNAFYHPGSKQIKLIDPRGDAYGNVLYDLAKITHSAYYPYDYVDAELYLNKDGETLFFDNGKEAVRQAYKKLFVAKYGESVWRLTLFLTASLFLSMIPLHSHNAVNQRLFYALYRKAAADSGIV
jgi:dTDP-glucose pyrophosphorylase